MMRRVRSSKCGHAERNFRFNSDRVFMLRKHTSTVPWLIPLFIYSALAPWPLGLDDLAGVGDLTVAGHHLPRGSRRPLAFAVHAEPVLLHVLHVVSADHSFSGVVRM